MIKLSQLGRMTIKVRSVQALEDNYMYLVYDDTRKQGLAVDPVEPEKIKLIAADLQVSILAALITHHHWDHAGGTPDFHKLFPSASIYAGDSRVEKATHKVTHGEGIEIGGMKIVCYSTPCHTKGHVCYFLDSDQPLVFTGDTLFIAGCGKFFEGTADQMHINLNRILSSLPDNTLVYPGHEYTVTNLKFAAETEPQNKKVKEKLEWALKCRSSNTATIPSTLAEEKLTNPFMRVEVPSIQKKFNSTDPVRVMHCLREAKNVFKPRI